MTQKKIDFFIIGAQKCGTTSLYNTLGQHSQVEAPSHIKDLHYFSKHNLDYKEVTSEYTSQEYYLHGAVNYLYQADCAEKIYAYNPSAKIIVLLRNPIDRFISAFKFNRELGIESKSIDEVANIALDHANSKTDVDTDYLGHSDYYPQLKRYVSLFRENLLIILFEELLDEETATLKRITNFLGIRESELVSLSLNNKTSNSKLKWLNSLVFTENVIRKNLRPVLRKLLTQKQRTNIANKVRLKNKAKSFEIHNLSEISRKNLRDLLEPNVNMLKKEFDLAIEKYWKL